MKALLLLVCGVFFSTTSQGQYSPCTPSGFKLRSVDTIDQPLQYDTVRSVPLYSMTWSDCQLTILYDSTRGAIMYTLENRSDSKWMLVGRDLILRQQRDHEGFEYGNCALTVSNMIPGGSCLVMRQIAPRSSFIGNAYTSADTLLRRTRNEYQACVSIYQADTQPFAGKLNFCYDDIGAYPNLWQEIRDMSVKITIAANIKDYLGK